jgi:ribosomal-protein-alanine N-acetyltransferase
MNSVSKLETARLFLRPITMEDAAQIQAIFPQWEIVRYLLNKIPWPYPADGAETFIREKVLPTEERGEAWHWSLRPKIEPGRIIGVIDLHVGKINRGFWMDPKWQGRGLMMEAADAVTDFWFDVLKFPVLRAPKAIANEASRRISIKQRMRVVAVEEHDHVSGRLPAEVWEITAEEWRAHRQANQETWRERK